MQNDTVYAPSTAIGGAIALIRVSGPDTPAAACLFDADVLAAPRTAVFTRAIDGGETVDTCVVIRYAAPRSYTGEDMLEICCHGGAQTVRKLLSMLAGCGFRPAEPGEFTRRAFMNGKMDLSQAEAVMDVINAQAEQSRRAAVLQLEGLVSRRIAEVEDLLTDSLACVDAALDYPDEAESDALDALPGLLANAEGIVSLLIDEGRRGRVLRDGVRAVIAGRPNVGKSSLLNALLGRERAIVTPLPGTTRDVLDEPVSFEGVPVRLIDTAGLRDSADAAETVGVERARDELARADVVLLVLDGSGRLTDADRALLAETEDLERIILRNKVDLPQIDEPDLPRNTLSVSARTGEGLDALKARVVELTAPRADCACLTNERHIYALECALDALRDAQVSRDLDCAATDLRDALRQVGSITGSDVSAAVIERIFARFCVGK